MRCLTYLDNSVIKTLVVAKSQRSDPRRASDERRRSILDAALRVFERKGLGEASMRAIALEAGCTTGAIYPLFDGKEALYAELLEASLQRLFSAVAAASAGEVEPLASLRSAARAWFEYYRTRPAECDLGLYLHGSGRVKGLGRRRDERLNALLLQSIDVFKVCFQRMPPSDAGDPGAVDAWARAERDALFAGLVGILLLDRSRRTVSIGTDAHAVFATLERGLVERFG